MKCPRCNGLIQKKPGWSKVWINRIFWDYVYQCMNCARIYEPVFEKKVRNVKQ